LGKVQLGNIGIDFRRFIEIAISLFPQRSSFGTKFKNQIS
jgi:hypothetical protein